MLNKINKSYFKYGIGVSLFLIAGALFNLSFNDDIVPFTSDGCSVFPDGTLQHQQLWLQCCTAHDFDYWQGGTYKQRQDSDKRLKHCVEQVGQPQIAEIMLAGIRVGGSPYFPTTYRWGYGWPYPRGYKALTDSEISKIEIIIKEDNDN
ncbi:hypothetical protein [Shewanella sp. TC10]|uniref:hypothetical protein n=1 Tax=Shewanella sp. TC10 TaxID=1419739 RepID=UPI001E513B80|nr:hypothetical protein [Shewanella sp. TC10]